MGGIPEKYKKEVNDLILKFIWDNKPNQTERNICFLYINEGGIGMIDIYNFVKNKQIKLIYKIINSEMDSWNVIGKYWLQKYDNKFGVYFFLGCIHSKILSRHYTGGSCYTDSKNDILDKNIFGNAEIKFNKHPRFFSIVFEK